MLISFTRTKEEIDLSPDTPELVVEFIGLSSKIRLEQDYPQDMPVLFNDTNSIPIKFNSILRSISEDDIMYSKRVDFISDVLLYRGEASVGSNTTSPVWRIRKIIFAVDGDVQEIWAEGSADFNKIWDNKDSYNYL